jgi:hypothetical protein
MGINKDILRSDIVWLFARTPEEVLEHSGVTFHSPPGAGALLFLCKESIEGTLPAGGRVSEVNDGIFCHFITPTYPE